MGSKTHQFAGFDSPVEVFRAGTFTDAAGQSKTWTADELDAMVRNHSAQHPAPIVVGHPKQDAPAYGWVDSLKRVGDSLFATFSQVQPAFEGMVREGRFRNRSVKIVGTGDKAKVMHVGWLGAAPPAIEGLQPMSFAAEPEGQTFEFGWSDGYQQSIVARSLRSLRDFLIGQFGQDKADSVLPSDDMDSLTSAATLTMNAPDDSSADGLPSSFSAPAAQPGAAPSSQLEPTVDPKTQPKTFTQADIDAAVAAEAAKRAPLEQQVAQFSAAEKLAQAKTEVTALVAEGKLSPALAEGLAEFMAAGGGDATGEFTFAAADGTAKTQSRMSFFSAFLRKLPKQIEFGREQVGGKDDEKVDQTDPNALVTAAREYTAAQKLRGVDIEWHDAVAHVSKKP